MRPEIKPASGVPGEKISRKMAKEIRLKPFHTTKPKAEGDI
jgi:hypothetical protein